MDSHDEYLSVIEMELVRDRLRLERRMEDINRMERTVWVLFAAFAFGAVAAIVYEAISRQHPPSATFHP